MCDDYHYYKQRCQELENDLFVANERIAKLSRRIADVRNVVLSRNVTSSESVLNRIAWLAYDWKDSR